MNGNPAKIADVLITEYSDFLDYCVSSGKTYIEELTNADYIAFRTSRGLSRDYIAAIKNVIANYVPITDNNTLDDSDESNAIEVCSESYDHTESVLEDIADKRESEENEDENSGSNENELPSDEFQNFDDIDDIEYCDDIDHDEVKALALDLESNTVFVTVDDIYNRHLEAASLAEVLGVENTTMSEFPVQHLGLSVRSINCLCNAKCKTVSDVLALSTNQLKSIKNMGIKSVSEIVEKVQSLLSEEKISAHVSKPQNEPTHVTDLIKSVITEFVESGEADVSMLSEKELLIYQQYRDSIDILGPELCKCAMSHDNYVEALIEMFNSFADPCIKYMKTIESANKHINKLALVTKEKRALPFMDAYVVCSNKELNKLPNICDANTCVYQIPALLEKYRNTDEFEELAIDVNKFLAWLDFDIDAIIKNLVDKIREAFSAKGSRALEIFKRRLEGESLEEVGSSMSISRERVRQIEAKVYRTFWGVYKRQKYDLIMLVYAIHNGDSVIYYDELKETLGDFATILRACLKKATDLDCYEYSKYLDALIINYGAHSNALHDIKEKLSLAMQEMPEVFEEKEYQYLMGFYSVKYIIPEEILKKSVDESYKKTGIFYHRGRMTVVYMCDYVLKERFPAGYKIADEFEGRRFKQYLTEFFGERAGRMTARAIDAKVMDLGCLCDRGKYIHKDFLNVEADIIHAINDYVEASPRSVLSYAEVYDGLADYFVGTQITNRYLLQGALKKYRCNYRTNRDYILKEDGISVADELDAFIEQYGIIYKGDIFTEFHSLDDIRLGQIIARCPNVYSIDNGYYIHASLFDIRPGDYSGIREYLQDACEDIPVNIRTVYEDLSVQFPQFMSRNDFDDRNKLFAALNHMFGSEFKFSRPYIAKLGTGDISNRSVILQHLQEYDSIEIDELIGICETNNIHYACLSYLCQLIAPDFIRIDRDTFMRSEIAGVDEQIIEKTSKVIAEQLEFRDYIVASKFEDFIWLPDISVDWNPFLLESICLLNKKINTVFLIGNSLAHPNTVFVSDRYKDDTFITMVLKILKEKVLQGYFNTKVELREWLLEEEFIEGKLPNILEGAQYFFVTEKGVQYTGKEIE